MGKLLIMLVTGPLMILGVVLAVPVALLFMALGGVTLVFTLWTLFWGAVWISGTDPDAWLRFFQALGAASISASCIAVLTWAIASIKDLVSGKKQPMAMADKMPSPPMRNQPANDSGFVPAGPRI